VTERRRAELHDKEDQGVHDADERDQPSGDACKHPHRVRCRNGNANTHLWHHEAETHPGSEVKELCQSGAHTAVPSRRAPETADRWPYRRDA
jgi:hypothetical protein